MRDSTQPQGISEALEPAPLWRRAVAVAIDAALVMLIGLGFSGTFGASEDVQQSVLLFLIVLSFYHIVSLAVKGATPGKTAMGLSVTDGQGNQLEPDKAILRFIILLVSVVTVVPVVLDGYLVAFDRKWQRTLHDRIAGTVVIRGKPAREQARR